MVLARVGAGGRAGPGLYLDEGVGVVEQHDGRKAAQTQTGGTRGSRSARRPGRPRRNGIDRRTQIALATLRIMALHGLHGTTVSRIAAEVGMEAPSLYAHFRNREEMLLAAVDILCERVQKHITQPSGSDMLERLRAIGESHAAFITKEFDGFVLPTFELLVAPRDSGLAEVSGQRQIETISLLSSFVEEGKRQGTIRPDMDPKVAAYEMVLLFWAEDVAQLMGIDEFVSDGISREILDCFLRDMAASPEAATVAAPSED